MLISFSMIVLGTQLVMPIADGVPKKRQQYENLEELAAYA
jgi:hypothetical protein